MPFKSNKQRAFMFSKKPGLAKKFAADVPDVTDALGVKKKKKKFTDALS